MNLHKFVNKNKIPYESQFGFRIGIYTSMALLNLMEHITASFDNKECTPRVFIDMKKAF